MDEYLISFYCQVIFDIIDIRGGTQVIKNMPANEETWVQSLGQEDALEWEMATHSSILAWKIPGTKDPGLLQSMGSQRAGHD